MIISICIPYYFGSKYIEDLLHSISEQNHGHDLEILISNDSPDDLEIYSIIPKFKNLLEIKLINNEKNIGAARNLINLYKHSNGEIIIHFDQDDYLVGENSLSELILNLIENPNISSTFPSIIGPRKTEENSFLSDLITVENIVLREVIVPHSGHTFWKKDFCESDYSNFWIDLDKYRLILKNGNAKKISSAIVYIRANSESLTSVLSFNLFMIYIRIIRNLIFISNSRNFFRILPHICHYGNAAVKTFIKLFFKNVFI